MKFELGRYIVTTVQVDEIFLIFMVCDCDLEKLLRAAYFSVLAKYTFFFKVWVS